ncbi:hypothetical protein J4231_02750 [Candidatus Woesearchaeota archaeon]|nr:hypothetical protein [Candidatus Woesearchaeota archaeon]
MDFECINTENMEEAYNLYLLKSIAIRFARRNEFVPNIEVKFPKGEIDHWTLAERKKVLLNNRSLFISPFELQIPFKLFLGTEKDIEDARHLYKIFQDKIDLTLLHKFNKKLKIDKELIDYLG